MPVDPWHGDKGGMGEYILTVREPVFDHVERDKGAKLRLLLRGEAQTVDGKLTDWVPDYTLGTGWEASPDKKQAAHPGGDDKYFHENSGIMNLVRAAIAVGAPLKSRGFPDAKHADLWKGLKFRMENKIVSTFESDTEKDEQGNPRKIEVRLDIPVEYLGEAGAAGATTSAPVAGGAVPSNGNGEISDGQLKVMASEANDFYSFVDAATKLGVPISDPRLKQAGIWAEVRS